MNRPPVMLLLFLLPLALVSCNPAREAGRSAAGGVFDEAQERAEAFREWYAREGKTEIKGDVVEIVKAGVDGGLDAAGAKLKLEVKEKVQAARDTLNREWEAKMAEVERKGKEGTATPWEIALWVLMGGAGGGGTAKVLERLLIGKRSAPSTGNGNGNGGGTN